MNAEKQHVMSYEHIQALSDVDDNFVFYCVNVFTHNTEVSSVQMIHNLLDYEDCFQANNMYCCINLY